MFGIQHYETFFTSAVIFSLSPGVDSIFVINKALGSGRRAGFYTIGGIELGNTVHIMLAAFGVSMLIARSDLAFTIVKYLGAAYMAYLGIMSLISKNELFAGPDNKGKAAEKKEVRTMRQHFVSGLVTNLLNPKIPIFCIAFFPPFIAPGHGDDPLPFILLGITFALLGGIWFLVLTFFAGTFSDKLRRNPRAGTIMGKATGLVFLALAAMMVMMTGAAGNP